MATPTRLAICGLFLFTGLFAVIGAAHAAGEKVSDPKSCSATDCHGSRTPNPNGRALGVEYTTWKEKDKHSRSFTVLASEKGKAIATTLGVTDPSQDGRCLKCHGPEGWDKPELRGEQFDVTAGNSCDDCHGHSEKWRVPHSHTRQEFRSWTHDQSLAAGMRDTQDRIIRTNMCLECHMAIDPALLAANHPDITFELDHMQQIMPPHWVPENAASRVQSWAVGQLLCLREALTQFSGRLHDPQVSPIYKADAWRIAQGYAITSRVIAARIKDPDFAAVQAALDAIAASDGQSSDAAARAAASPVRQALEKIARAAGRFDFTIALQRELLKDLAGLGQPVAAIGYRGAEEVGLALFAVNSALEAAHEADARYKPAITQVLRYSVQRNRYEGHESEFASALRNVAALSH